MTRRMFGMAVGGLLVGGLVGCADDKNADGTPAAGARLDAAEFEAAMKSDGVVLLDVRTPAEFAAGHIEGAKNTDVEAADFGTQIAALDKAATYAVYCRSGNRSQVAMDQMKAAGFTSYFDLKGGIGAWTSAGKPVVAGS